MDIPSRIVEPTARKQGSGREWAKGNVPIYYSLGSRGFILRPFPVSTLPSWWPASDTTEGIRTWSIKDRSLQGVGEEDLEPAQALY